MGVLDSVLEATPRRLALTRGAATALALSATALLTALCFALAHRDGLHVTPDGWAYWQGAVSLADGHGYRYFSGHPIHAWPPLYSLYLAVWTWALGPTALAINWATGALVSLQAAAWLALALRLAPPQGPLRAWAAGAAAAFIVAFVALNQQEPLAHWLLYLFLPLQLICADALVRARAPKLRDAAGLAVASALAALSHNLGFAFTLVICAGVLLVATHRRALVAPIFASAGLTTAVWIGARFLLGQTDSHLVGLGHAGATPVEYLTQGLAGAAELLAPDLAGWAVLAGVFALALVYRRDPGVRFAGVVAALIFATSLIVFSLTNINDPFSGRFLQFAPLLIVPALLLRLSAEGPRRFALFVALVLPNVAYLWLQFAAGPTSADVPNLAEISREAPPGEIVMRGHRLLVGPIDWEEPDQSSSLHRLTARR